MGKKIFVSYKYADSDVRKITNDYFHTDTVRDYVNKLEEKIGKSDIYKGESDDNDLSQLTDDSIWNQLKQKIYDSSITIVLISPNMKTLWKSEKDQWIPQEISYSLKAWFYHFQTHPKVRKFRLVLYGNSHFHG